MSDPKPFITFRPGPVDMAPPTKLKKPYLFSLPIADLEKWIKEVKAWFELLELGKECQCVLFGAKPVSKGKRVKVWLLCGWPGALEDYKGLTEPGWDHLCGLLTAKIDSAFPGAKPYKEPWSNKRAFQYNFETYVQYTELLVP